MNESNMSWIKELFYNNSIVIGKLYIVRMVKRALSTSKINQMHTFDNIFKINTKITINFFQKTNEYEANICILSMIIHLH